MNNVQGIEQTQVAEEEKIENEYNFIEHINKEDKKEFNLFIFDTKRGNSKSNFVFGLFAIFFGVWTIIQKNYIIGAICILLSIFLIFFSKALNRKLLIRSADKKLDDEILDIDVTLNDLGVIYKLVGEETRPRMDWGVFQQSYEDQKYIFIEINSASIVIIKKEECPYITEVRELIINKINNHKYLEIK